MNPTVETSVSIIELAPDGVLWWRYKENAVVGLTEAEEEANHISALLDTHWDGGCWLLINIGKMRALNREARRFFASEELHSNFGVQGLALVMGSPIGTMIGNIYHSINRTKHPTKLFVDEESAQRWIQSQIERTR